MNNSSGKPASHASKSITEYQVRSDYLEKIIRPLRTASYEVDHEWGYVKKMLATLEEDYGLVEINPDFQRGHVWTEDQKRCYIENCLRGVVASNGFMVQFNCPNWNKQKEDSDLPRGVQCIDGLQRMTAVFEFLDGKVKPFGLSFSDFENSKFSIKRMFRFRVAIHDFQYKKDLLQHYLDLNTGGTPHSEAEIARVKEMFEAAKKTASFENEQ